MQSYRPPTYFKQGRYHTLGVLGTGTYGQVIRCRDEQSGKEVAVKVAQQNQAYRLSALNEIRALQALQSCPDAVNMLDCFEEGGHVCIVTELLYKNLYDILRAQSFEPLGVHDIRHVALHLLRALAALHQAGYMHCDVKPENIMLRFSPAASTAQQGQQQQESNNNAGILGEKYSYYALQEQAVNFPYKSHAHAQAHQPLPGNFAAPATTATSLSSSATSYYASSGLIESPSEDNSTSTLLSEDEPLSLLNMYTHTTMAAAQPASESAAHAFASAANKKAAVYTSHQATAASSPQPHHVPASTSSSVNFEATCLIDFGAVRKFSENNYFDVQSLWYRAPEVLCELPYTIGIDAWSVGCVLFELYTGKALFPGQNTQDQLARIVQLRGCPSPAALHARLAGGSVQTALHAPHAGVATEAQLRRWMRRCRCEAFRAVRAKARQGCSTAATAHVQEQIQVSLDELLNCRGTNKSHALIDEEDEEEGDDAAEDAADEAESELLGLILALLEPDESHRLGCSAALLHPFLTRTYYCNNNNSNNARLNYAPSSHIVPPSTYQDAHASNGLLWTAHHHQQQHTATATTMGAASASGPHTHCGAPSVGHGSNNGLSAYNNNSNSNSNHHQNSSTTSVNVMFDEAAKTALTLPMMNPAPQNTLQASSQHTAMMNTMPHYTVLSAGPGVGHGAQTATHVLAPNELPATCNNGIYTTAATTSSSASMSNTSQMMGNVNVMHTMNSCLPSQQAMQSNNNNNNITSTTTSSNAATTAQMLGLLMPPTMNNNNNNNANVNTTMAYNNTHTQGVLQYQAVPHNNSNNNNNNMVTTPTTNTTSVLDMSSPLYNMHTGSTSFAALGQDLSRQQQHQQQQHVMQCMAVNEPRSQSDSRLNMHQDMNNSNSNNNTNAGSNNNHHTATTVFMPMAMSPVMYYQPVPMTLQAMQPRLELPGNNTNNNNVQQQQQQQQQQQHAHVTYSAVLTTPSSMQPFATQPSQASSIYPCYVSTEQTPNYAGHLTTSTSMNMASTGAPVRRDMDERTMQSGLMLQMPSATTNTATTSTATNPTTTALSNHPYAAQSHYSRFSGYSCLAQDSYGGRMDGMYYFNVSLPLTQQQTILLSSS